MDKQNIEALLTLMAQKPEYRLKAHLTQAETEVQKLTKQLHQLNKQIAEITTALKQQSNKNRTARED